MAFYFDQNVLQSPDQFELIPCTPINDAYYYQKHFIINNKIYLFFSNSNTGYFYELNEDTKELSLCDYRSGMGFLFTYKETPTDVYILSSTSGDLYTFDGEYIYFITEKPSGTTIKKFDIYDSDIYLDCGGDIYKLDSLDSGEWIKTISIYPGGNQLWTGYPNSPETHVLFPSQIIIQTENFGILEPPHLFISQATSFWISDDGLYLYPYSNTYGTYDYVLSGGTWVYVDFYPYYEYFWIKGPGVPGELSDYIKEANTVTNQGSGNTLYFSKTTTVEQDNLPETNSPYASSGYANGNFYTYYATDGYFRICTSGNSSWTKTISVPYTINAINSHNDVVFWSGTFYSGGSPYDEGTFIANSSGTSIAKINSNNYAFSHIVDFNGELYADRSNSAITYIEKNIYSATPTIISQATLIPFDGGKYYLYDTDVYVISQQTIYKNISGELKWICGSPYNETRDSYYSELSDLLFSNSGRIYAWAQGFDELYLLTDIGGPTVKIRVRNLRHKTSSTEERARGVWWKDTDANKRVNL